MKYRNTADSIKGGENRFKNQEDSEVTTEDQKELTALCTTETIRR